MRERDLYPISKSSPDLNDFEGKLRDVLKENNFGQNPADFIMLLTFAYLRFEISFDLKFIDTWFIYEKPRPA